MNQYLAVVGNNSRRIYDIESRKDNQSLSNIKLLWNSNHILITHYESITRKEARKYERLLKEKNKIQSLIEVEEGKEKSKLTQKLREINHGLVFPCQSVGVI